MLTPVFKLHLKYTPVLKLLLNVYTSLLTAVEYTLVYTPVLELHLKYTPLLKLLLNVYTSV